ncbi:MAG: small ribosomal subunit biogenesis GTPase RsgA [Microcystaceae cyanobacterium]
MTDHVEIQGTVVAVQANFYQVRPDAPQFDHDLLCTRRTRLKKIRQRVMVGDRVKVEEVDVVEGRGAIAEVFPRKSELSRPLVANVDQILLVFTVAEPTLDQWQLSRFLVKAEASGLEVCLCLNKIDLIDEKQQLIYQTQLKDWGYNPILISVKQEIGLDKLGNYLKEKTTILAGPSGVGKSSLINWLIPQSNQRINQVSGKLQKGRHTTRHVELFDLPQGGFLADSPGFNQPDIDQTPQELIQCFPEARERLETGICQFNDCLHRNEPHCVVRGDWERYDHYLQFLEEASARQQKLHQQSDPETALKLKIKASGQRQYEPKLESKKYRRQSRRHKHQQLQELYDPQKEEEIGEL